MSLATHTSVPRIAVLIVAYNGREYLADCLDSLRRVEADGLHIEIFLLDNASPDPCEDIRDEYPEVHWICSEENLGFAEGNNFIWSKACEFAQDAEKQAWDYAYLLNQDTIVDKRVFAEAVAYAEANPQAGAVQSLLILHPETELINTAGNELHYLGFGLPTQYRELRSGFHESGEINYPSGAAVLIRSDILRQHGLFTPHLFMYLEDAELGWKLHLIQRVPHVCATSCVFHKYQFKSTLGSYQFLERNRLWLVLSHYRWATLLLMLPVLIMMELGQWFYALKNGLLSAKAKASSSIFNKAFRTSIRNQRAWVRTNRQVSDQRLLRTWSGTLNSPHLDFWVLRKLVNQCWRVICGFYGV